MANLVEAIPNLNNRVFFGNAKLTRVLLRNQPRVRRLLAYLRICQDNTVTEPFHHEIQRDVTQGM